MTAEMPKRTRYLAEVIELLSKVVQTADVAQFLGADALLGTDEAVRRVDKVLAVQVRDDRRRTASNDVTFSGTVQY